MTIFHAIQRSGDGESKKKVLRERHLNVSYFFMQHTNSNRVIEYGEVFTSEVLVNRMLNLVDHEAKRFDSLILEPACGTGNFLIEVLRRRLEFIESNFKTNQLNFEFCTLQAVGSIYGMDILPDNVAECQTRLYETTLLSYQKTFDSAVQKKFMDVIKFVLERNILWGDFLSQTIPNSNKPVVFSQWNFIEGNNVVRIDYPLKTLLDCQPMEEGTLFGEKSQGNFIPKPLQEFKAVNYLEVCDAKPAKS